MDPNKPTFSLRLKLFAAIALVAIMPLLVLAMINGRNMRRILEADASQSLLLIAAEVATTLDDFMTESLSDIDKSANMSVVSDYFALSAPERAGSAEEAALQQFLAGQAQEHDYVRSYGLLDLAGVNILDTHTPYMGASEANRDYFLYFQSAEAEPAPYASAVQFRDGINDGLLYFSVPVVSGSGDIVGYLRAEYDAVALQNTLAEKNDLAGPDSFGVLFDENHLHLAHGVEPAVNFVPIIRYDSALDAQLKAAYRLPELSDDMLYIMQLDELEAGLSNYEDRPSFAATDVATGDLLNQVAVTKMQTQPWLIAFFQPQEIFLALAEQQVRQTVLLVAGIAGIAILAAYLFGGLLVRPLNSLTETVTQFADGDLSARSDVQASDEIGVLAAHFNEMALRVGDLLTGLEDRSIELENLVKEQQLFETKLLQQRRFLQQVININPSFIFAKDRQGRFILVNQAFADIYNTNIEGMLGKTDADFNPDPAKVAQFRRDDLQVFESGKELFIPEQRTVSDYGEERWWQTIKLPLHSQSGLINEVLTVVTEITDRKKNESALLIARDRALEASRVKSEILSKANHELQTPLGAILGYTEMLETGYFGAISEAQVNILKKITNRSQDLTQLIKNLLDQANMDSQASVQAQTAFLPKDLLHQMHEKMDPLAKSKLLSLTSEIDNDFPTLLHGDPNRLQSILTNLVGNGIKFTDKGYVHVRMFQPDQNTWAIEVSDTGPGIPDEAFSYIFEPFRQVDGSITRAHQGFGLGLSLAKEMALSLEGDIQLTSIMGKGSTFTVIMPYAPVLETIA